MKSERSFLQRLSACRECDKIDVEKLKRFVLNRQNEDGGFCFCKPLESTLPETFYAVSILKSINCEIPKEDSLIDFLERNLRKETYVIYYIFKTFERLGIKPPKDYEEWIISKLRSLTKAYHVSELESGGITATYQFESPNVLKDVYALTESLKVLNRKVSDEIISFVKGFKKGNGFGVNSPNLKDTFYAVNVVGCYDDLKEFVTKHRCDGGFSKSPNAYPPYLEDTYYALSILKMCEEEYSDKRTLKFVMSLQNEDGGFRRSIYLGVSTLEFSYYAVECLKCLGMF
ncbi:prenyltransferase/squalene oxidase repeat-containing protein [Archaeoglobus sp.]